MGRHLRFILVIAGLGLAGTSPAAAGDADRNPCVDPKPLREMSQDETRTIPELCTWRDDSARPDAHRDMMLGQQQEAPPAPKINLSMEQRHVIKEIVLKEMKPKRATADVTAGIGDPVPAGVDVLPFPAEISAKIPQVRSHGFFVTDDHVIVVNTKDNKIEDVIE
jgi:hypothetical protein